MWKKMKFMTSRVGAFLWPLIKKMLIASAPIIEEAALIAVKITFAKYAGQLNTRADKLQAHEDAFGIIVNNVARYGITLAQDGVETSIDLAIKAAVIALKEP